MRYYLFFLMVAMSSGSFALNYEIKPAEKNIILLNDYLDSLGIPAARIKSKCKDGDCVYHLKIGNKETSVNKKTKLITQSRYIKNTFSIIKDDEDTQIFDYKNGSFNNITRKSLIRCLSSSALAKGISMYGNPLCLNSEYLYAGSLKKRLPVDAIYGEIGTNYKGFWQATFIGEDYNIYVGNHKGFNKIEVGLNP